MMIDAIVLCSIGLLATLLPSIGRYRSFLARRMARRADAPIPADQQSALRARATRRARAMGLGILAAGVIWLVITQLWPEGREQPSGGYVVVSLLFVFSAAGLVLVEILRPGDVTDGPRFARATTPALTDYVAPANRVLSGVFVVGGLAVLVGTLLLTQSRWFDAATIWRSPALFLLVAVPVLVLLSGWASRRVLDAPQPARDERELYWQDGLRAHTLSTLMVPPALVSLLAIAVSGAALDEAASAAATSAGEVGPSWSLWLLIAGYLLPFVLVVAGAIAATAAGADTEHVRKRLWPAGVPGEAPNEAGTEHS